MTDPARNAALWYAQDAYDPTAKGLNGRRVAGESFLRGFLDHADTDVIQGLVSGTGVEKAFREVVEPKAKGRKIETYYLHDLANQNAISTVNYPAPVMATEVWRRYHKAQTAFSICGITHTTATKAIMQGLFDLMSSPVEPWDGVICTSNSVREHVTYQLDLYEEYAKRRYQSNTITRPSLTTIPLGISTEDFVTKPANGKQLRTELGIEPDATVFMVLSRLSPHEKFDPIPVYRALALAQAETKGSVHLILCGYYPDTMSRKVFENGVKAAMPKVPMHLVDGADKSKRMAAFAAADVFLFPIDNLQETFGLAPIEAMAAGLPLIVSDWDGMKDTVTTDVGFRIPTRFAKPEQTVTESLRYQIGTDNYGQYTTLMATMTQIDVPEMARKMVLLIQDPDLRRKMGVAGQKRARAIYDWSAVIPQMQDFWAELTAIRRAAGAGQLYQGLDIPIAPPAGRLFQGYPTTQGDIADRAVTLVAGAGFKSFQNLRKTRRLDKVNRQLETVTFVRKVMDHLSNDVPVTPTQIAQNIEASQNNVERVILMLLKYDLIRFAAD